MRIYDLTGGKYSILYPPLPIGGHGEMHSLTHEFSRRFRCGVSDSEELLDKVPIFLVETSMVGKYVEVPCCHYWVRVPEDNGVMVNEEDFNVEEWLNQKERDLFGEKKGPRESRRHGGSVADYLGVYISYDINDEVPRQIFIWMDKIIVDCATRCTQDTTQIHANAVALFGLVLYHEIGHALMDIELYGLIPLPYFTYANDPMYRFIEEACANSFAFSVMWHNKLTDAQETFLKDFMRAQGGGYAYGLHLHHSEIEIVKWMCVKLLFDYDIAVSLANMLRYGHHHFDFIKTYELCDGWLALKNQIGEWRLFYNDKTKQINGLQDAEKAHYDHDWMALEDNTGAWRLLNADGVTEIKGYCDIKTVGHEGWLAVKNPNNNKWRLIEADSYQPVAGFKEYGFFWSFDDHGLCTVCNYDVHPYLYGCVNLNGEEQIPLCYDAGCISYNSDGIATVKKGGEEFKINVNGNRIE